MTPSSEGQFSAAPYGFAGSVAALDLEFRAFYSPDYLGETGRNWVFETAVERALPQWGPFTPTVGGLVGLNDGDVGAGGRDYWYWNAGVELAFRERFAVDVRYWDTDRGGCGAAQLFQCDERAVATLSAEF